MTLTPRQLEILRLTADGLTCAEIGKKLFIGEQTVRTHRQAIRARMGAATLPHAIALAYQRGILGTLPDHLVSSALAKLDVNLADGFVG